ISPKSRAHLITTEHNTNNRRRDMKIMKLIDRKVYQQYEKIIAISDATASNLASYLSVHHEIMTIANGIDVDYFQNAVPINKVLLDPSIKDDDFIITMVGGFREQKDQDTIIKALRILPENIKLVLVGDGERRKKCEKLALKEGVLGRVLFLGIRKDVANILKASDVVVMSSHWEGFGLAVVEGMAAQKSVIASDVSGLSNIVKGAGLLFPPGDTKKLAQLIIDLEKNNEYAKQVASACYIRAKQYDINKMVDALIDVYSSILSPKK
ncbi:MAG: glycosyltransferase family 4 protein, partial [Bacteroidaceae bacterium]|nr:glycosyltransferase family 4 protein [Bacteroidaceae bacterium]